MRDRREVVHEAILVAFSAILVSLGIARLPPAAGLMTPPSTPFDRVPVPSISRSYRILSHAANLVPRDAVVSVRSEPRDPDMESGLFQNGVALLPGRKVVPAAHWGIPTPQLEEEANYVVVVGAKPASPLGRLILETPDGTVWHRSRP